VKQPENVSPHRWDYSRLLDRHDRKLILVPSNPGEHFSEINTKPIAALHSGKRLRNEFVW